LPIGPHARRLTSALSPAVLVLAAALAMPSQTLARSRKPPCSSSSPAAHSKGGRTAHRCARSSHKAGRRHASKRHAKHPAAGKGRRSRPTTLAAVNAASCADGSEPVRARKGSFSCRDGSEPECEDGSAPTSSRNGAGLVCPASSEDGSGPGEECEEALASMCAVDAEPVPGEHACQASAGGGSSFVCENEDEG
jgi:hypothetical protein